MELFILCAVHLYNSWQIAWHQEAQSVGTAKRRERGSMECYAYSHSPTISSGCCAAVLPHHGRAAWKFMMFLCPGRQSPGIWPLCISLIFYYCCYLFCIECGERIWKLVKYTIIRFTFSSLSIERSFLKTEIIEIQYFSDRHPSASSMKKEVWINVMNRHLCQSCMRFTCLIQNSLTWFDLFAWMVWSLRFVLGWNI